MPRFHTARVIRDRASRSCLLPDVRFAPKATGRYARAKCRDGPEADI
jgi:hypothetical protein